MYWIQDKKKYKDVQNVKWLYKKKEVVIIWHVKDVNINFVGYVEDVILVYIIKLFFIAKHYNTYNYYFGCPSK